MPLFPQNDGIQLSGVPDIDTWILRSYDYGYRLGWIPCSDIITSIEPSQYTVINRPTYNAICERPWGQKKSILLLLGNHEKIGFACMSEFFRVLSLPTHEYLDPPNKKQFRRYSDWLLERNSIDGFTKYEDNYYLVATRRLQYDCSRYGFCSACGILRCSPVWCICGHKEVSNTWTSNNKSLDEFIKKTQLQTNSANDAYLEWIPFDCIDADESSRLWLDDGMPTSSSLQLIPVEITEETNDLWFDKVTIQLLL
jgi:hypothetical protein